MSTDSPNRIPVHPVADLFPMLPDDELRDLADDIKANGLQQALVIDSDGVLIDGRNRLAACELVGVEPSFTELNGADPVTFILSANLARRHMTKGQRAMAGVMALANKVSSRKAAHIVGVNDAYIGYARTIAEYAPDLIQPVLDGAVALNQAYDEARDRKQAAESTESRMEELRNEAPDLADQVVEERLTLAEAMGALRERRQEIEEERRATTKNLAEAFILLDPGNNPADETAHQWGESLAPELLSINADFSVERIDRIIKVLQALRKEVK